MVSKGPNGVEDPVKFLLEREEYHDWTVVVKDPHSETQEEFGVQSSNLAAHSSVFRTMMTDPKWVKQRKLEISNMSPETFNLIYRFVNGGDIPNMSREDAADLVLASDMYMIPRLVKKGCKRLVPTKVEEVFPALVVVSFISNNELEPHVINIVQRNTSEVMTSTTFLDLDGQCVEFIVKQETLSLTEKDVWKNVKWANHQVASDEKKNLRSVLGGVLKYIRFCTLTQQAIAMEVASTNVLNGDELSGLFCAVISNQPWDWPGLCNTRAVRQLPKPVKKDTVKPDDTVYVFKVEKNHSRNYTTHHTNVSWFTIRPVKKIELKSMVFKTKQHTGAPNSQNQGSYKVVHQDAQGCNRTYFFEGPKNTFTLTLLDPNNKSVVLEANRTHTIKVVLSSAQTAHVVFETGPNNHSIPQYHHLYSCVHSDMGNSPEHICSLCFAVDERSAQEDIMTVLHQSPVHVHEIHYKIVS